MFVPSVGPRRHSVAETRQRAVGAWLAGDALDSRQIALGIGFVLVVRQPRNAFAQTVASPYCVRHAPGAPVSTPLDWKEVRPTLKPVDFNLGNFAKRLAKPDPWADFFKIRQDLMPALKAVRNL
jgi:bifunctional non-homologous end joining protein LigD